MKQLFTTLAITAALLGTRVGGADTYLATVRGSCTGGDQTSFQALIEFTPTGGNFANGTGTAIVRFTLENTTGLIPFQSPAKGNPILTSFYFNVPPGTLVLYTEGRILAGSTFYSTGTTVNGIPVPAGCTVLVADLIRTDFYELQGSSSTGQYGIFTNSLQTAGGVAAGLVDPEVFAACVPQGDFFSPLVIGGQVRFTLTLGNLGTTLDSAADFQLLCSLVSGMRDPSSFAGKFQGTDIGGEGSCFNGTPCGPTAVAPGSWGAIKLIYR
ncbi:MAG TPA: hypothetical protein VGK89_08410 [Candidatus Eisenbacteria bacterium]|jgi:hypothetical protein